MKGTLSATFVLSCCIAMLAPAAGQTIRSTNTRPTFSPIADLTTRYSPDLRFIKLVNVTAGHEPDQEVNVSVSSKDQDLIETLGADLTGNGNGFIYYKLKQGATGTATVQVTVSDNAPVPAITTRIFHITVSSLLHDVPAITAPVITKTVLNAYPNPAIVSTQVWFSTPRDERSVAVDLYSLTGAKIRQLYNGSTKSGQSYSVSVNSRNLPAGVYLVRLAATSHTTQMQLAVGK